MAPVTITSFKVHDVRFPTNVTGDGTDAMNKECDYSAAYVELFTSSDLKGQGMTFTIGRGNEIVAQAIDVVAQRIVGMNTEEIFADMGAFHAFLVGDPQHRWLGPEKGVIHLATCAVNNAVWDMMAKSVGKPVWKMVADFTPEEFVKCTTFRYITDFITPEEALAMLKEREGGKKAREADLLKKGYSSYTTSAGWLGYSDEKVTTLTKGFLQQGFTHFKLKIGADVEEDLRRGRLMRSIIDNPENMPKNHPPANPKSLEGKNAGPTGCVLMVDSNQVFDVPASIEYTKKLEELKIYFHEEPTAPDDAVGHATIRKALKPHGIGVATGEHAHNRMVFKQLLQLDAVDVVQTDSCRMSGMNELMAVMLMAAKAKKPIMCHAGGVGLCEYVIHLASIDYVCLGTSDDITAIPNVLEYVDHLHENFKFPVSLMPGTGSYAIPTESNCGYSIEMFDESLSVFAFPGGDYWQARERGEMPDVTHWQPGQALA